MTFTPGLEGLAERLASRKKDAAARKAETVWQAYLRRKAERKAAARARGRHNASSGSEDSGADGGASSPARGGAGADAFFQHDADPFADPFFQARLLTGVRGALKTRAHARSLAAAMDSVFPVVMSAVSPSAGRRGSTVPRTAAACLSGSKPAGRLRRVLVMC